MGITHITPTTEDVKLKNGEIVPRLITVKAVVKRENLRQGTDTNAKTRAWAKKLGEDNDNLVAGHVIAKLLGGSGTDLNNIVPMDRNFNNSDFKSFESDVKDALEKYPTGQNVEAHIKVDIRYPNSNTATLHEIKYDVDIKLGGENRKLFSITAIFNQRLQRKI